MTQKNFLYIHLLFKLIKTCIFLIIIVYQISSQHKLTTICILTYHLINNSLHLAKHFDETVGLVSGSIKNMLYLTQTINVLSDSSYDSLSASLGPGLADVDEDEGGEYAAIFHTTIKTG